MTTCTRYHLRCLHPRCMSIVQSVTDALTVIVLARRISKNSFASCRCTDAINHWRDQLHQCMSTVQFVTDAHTVIVLAVRISRNSFARCRYIHRGHGLNYLRFELWRYAPDTTCGACTLSACPPYSLSQTHWLLLFWPAEFPETRLPAADTYIEATV